MNIQELDFHILTLLMHSSQTGYALEQKMKDSHLWQASHQQVYRNLHKLKHMNLLSSEIKPQEGKPDKIVYSLTDLGLTAYHDYCNQVQPKSKKLHNLYTVMLSSKNENFYLNLFDELESEIRRLESLTTETSDSLERLAIKRSILILQAELQFIHITLDYFKETQQAAENNKVA